MVKNYTYDSAGNKSAFSVKVGDNTKLSLHYHYDGESKLTAVTDETGNEIAAYNYDADGNLSQRTVAGADLTATYAYDYQNRLTDLKNQTGNAGVISGYTSSAVVGVGFDYVFVFGKCCGFFCDLSGGVVIDKGGVILCGYVSIGVVTRNTLSTGKNQKKLQIWQTKTAKKPQKHLPTLMIY